MKLKLFLLGLLLIFPQTNLISQKNNSVYIAGRLWSGGKDSRPYYWNNGKIIDLSIPGGTTWGQTRSIFAAGKKIYIAGTYSGKKNGGGCYWVNGRRTDLKVNADADIYIKSLYVYKNDIYVIGHYMNMFERKVFPCYWKNGKKYDLKKFSHSAPQYIHVDDSGIYVLTLDGYWKNNKFYKLSLPNGSHGLGTHLYKNNNDVYIAGYYYYKFDNKIPCYWKNNKRIDLDLDTKKYTGSAFRITVYNNNVYVGGIYKELKKYGPLYLNWIVSVWKDGSRQDLTRPAGINFGANKMIFSGKDLYFIGFYIAGKDKKGRNKFKHCYYKNDKLFHLKGFDQAQAIFVNSN